MKKDIKLSRIHCAGCAENLEDKIREVDGVLSASVDFVSKVASVEVENKGAKEIIGSVEKAITKFDSSIKIVDTSEEEKEARREKVKKIVDLAFMCACVIFALVAYFLPQSMFWLKAVLFVVAYFLVAYDVLYVAAKNIFHGKVLDENFLMSVATIGALALQEWIEAIAVMFLYNIGEMLEEAAVSKSRKRIKSLLSIKAEFANLVENGEERQVELSTVKVGDIIRIKPGEKVPLDCEIIEGNSSFNTSAITGESKEFFGTVGSQILSGYINGEGVVLCKVVSSEKDSTASKIIELVESATKTKAKTEKFISKFAKWYTPIVVGIAVLLAVIPPIFGASFMVWLYRALTFLVVSCPCALVISVPLSYFAGLGAAARNGVLIKGTGFIEKLANVRKVIFDKTGTLTNGNFEVTKVFATDKSSEDEVLELIAYAESFSNHRIAKSIVKKYAKTINTAWVSGYTELAGMGVEAELFGEKCVVGNAELLKKHNIQFDEVDDGFTTIYLAKNGEYMGYCLIEDTLKEDSKEAIKLLKDLGIKNVCMFTGDNESVAKKVAGELGLDGYYASLLPDGKVQKLADIKQKNENIAFVGDGINDAPVLASVDVGISMGGVGSDIAIEASDVVLMTDQPRKVADAISVARKTHKIVIENISFIVIVKAVVLVLSALGLSGMWLAIFADVGLAMLAILNSLRAMLFKKKDGKVKDK